jgi:hypothetical protein
MFGGDPKPIHVYKAIEMEAVKNVPKFKHVPLGNQPLIILNNLLNVYL